MLAGGILLPRIILQNIFWYSFMLEAEQTLGSWCGWKAQVYWIIFSYLMGSRTLGLQACSIAPQSSILKLQLMSTNSNTTWYHTLNSSSNEIRFVRNCCTYTSPWPSVHSTSLPLHSLHFHTTVYPTLTSFHFTSFHCTSLYFTTYFMICTTPPLHLMYHKFYLIYPMIFS
jgi:hypothetical protein